MFGRALFSLSAALVCCLFTSTTRAQSLYSNWYLAHSITNPTPENYDFFGVAVSGVGNDKVLIGAWRDNTGATAAGSAYLYALNGTLLTTYTNPTPENYESFGFAVSGVGNDKVLIGAYQDNTGAFAAGSAYLYSTNGTLLTTYTNPTPEKSDNFGVAVSGVGSDKVLIGAQGDNTGATRAGSAYLYALNGTLLTTYTNPTPESGEYFGSAVSGAGNDKVLIGAYGDNMGDGSAYLYSTNGMLLNTYTNPTPESGDYFGWAVCGVGNDKVLIGAYHYNNTGGSDAGAAYLYSTNGTLLNTYTNPTPESADCFGVAVSGVGNDKVLIGASGDIPFALYAGAAYLYSTNGTLLNTYTNPTPDSGDSFGSAVSGVGSDKVLIGAQGDNTGASNAGSAYLYEVVPLLRIDPAPDPGSVRISWVPDTGTNWVLQAIPSLAGTNWINAPSGSTNPADFPGSASIRFFRLKRP